MKKIALCMGINDSYEHGVTRGVVRFAKQHDDWDLYGYGWMFRPLEELEFWEGDGIIARVESARDADRLAALRLPVIDVAGAYTGSGFYQVNNDDYATGRQAGEYLCSCGFKRFAYCGVRDVGWSDSRRLGFSDAIAPVCRKFETFVESLPWWEQLENSEHLGAWLDTLEYPVAIFAGNDTAGVKIAEVCRALSVTIPEEVAVMGVDNEDILCELSSPSLTSIELDCEHIGFQAAELIDRIIGTTGEKGTGETASATQISTSPYLIPPAELIERQSTQVFACDDEIVKLAVQFIRANATDRIDVGDVLQKVPASRRNLENRFKHHMNTTLHEEIQRVRIERAKILLKSTDMTVSSVSSECGFGTLQRFHAQFKRATGSSPGQFRKAIRNQSGI